jgi:pimeloyl-ACP methyl ester carboxylesterase
LQAVRASGRTRARTGTRLTRRSIHTLDTVRSMKKLAVVFLLLLLAVPIGGAIYESKVEEKDAAKFSAPGRLVEVNGRKIHMHCSGKGTPTVVFESTWLASSTEWDGLLVEVGKKFRACAYDRAGMGWSDPVAGDRTIRDFVDDLHGALSQAGEHPPYLMVGHSAGGVVVRAYQAAHPDEVTALVLVDIATPILTTHWPRVIDKMLTNLKRGRWLATVAALRLANPLHIEGREAALTYRPRTMLAAEQLVTAQRAALPSMPVTTSLPTVVLTHGKGGDWAGPGAIGPIDEAAIEQDWQTAQKELAAGPKSSLVVADKSGHMIQTEQPELIVQAIEKVAAETAKAETAKPGAAPETAKPGAAGRK